jgi:hypothetical protein
MLIAVTFVSREPSRRNVQNASPLCGTPVVIDPLRVP